jgi:hypothetical protein
MHVDANKLMNKKTYIMKHKKITEIEVEEIEKELQKRQPSHLEERGERLEQFGTIREGEQKPNAATAAEETEFSNKRN